MKKVVYSAWLAIALFTFSCKSDLQNEMNVIHDELARPGFNNKTQSERWVYESPDLGFKIIFIYI